MGHLINVIIPYIEQHIIISGNFLHVLPYEIRAEIFI